MRSIGSLDKIDSPAAEGQSVVTTRLNTRCKTVDPWAKASFLKVRRDPPAYRIAELEPSQQLALRIRLDQEQSASRVELRVEHHHRPVDRQDPRRGVEVTGPQLGEPPPRSPDWMAVSTSNWLCGSVSEA